MRSSFPRVTDDRCSLRCLTWKDNIISIDNRCFLRGFKSESPSWCYSTTTTHCELTCPLTPSHPTSDIMWLSVLWPDLGLCDLNLQHYVTSPTYFDLTFAPMWLSLHPDLVWCCLPFPRFCHFNPAVLRIIDLRKRNKKFSAPSFRGVVRQFLWTSDTTLGILMVSGSIFHWHCFHSHKNN